MIRGTLIAESIKPESSLKGNPITLIEIYREVATNASKDQPRIWTVIDFESSGSAESLADALAQVMNDVPIPWYCNFTSDDEMFVIYPKRVFRYKVGNSAGRIEAQEYGKFIGVPASQLDWH